MNYTHNPLLNSKTVDAALSKNKKTVDNYMNQKKDDDDFDLLDLIILDELLNHTYSQPKTHHVYSDSGRTIDTSANCTMPILDERISTNSSGCDSSCASCSSGSDCSSCD